MPISMALHLPYLAPARGKVFDYPCDCCWKLLGSRCMGRFLSPARISRKRSKLPLQAKVEFSQFRRCSPLLECDLLLGGNTPTSNEWTAVPDIWKSSAEKYGDLVALVDPYHDPPSTLTYKQLEREILCFSEGLRAIGANPEEKLALFADNSCRWLIADQGIMTTGAINVVRGTRSPVEELLQIYEHSESVALVVENADFLNRLVKTFVSRAAIRFVILLWGEKSSLAGETFPNVPIFEYKEIVHLGHESREAFVSCHEKGQTHVYKPIEMDNVATIVYTSGTTGNPKGVVLTHRNFLHQIKNFGDIIPAEAGDRFLSMLPPWHVYERACEYFIFTHGVEQAYTTVKNLKEDLQQYKPHYLISVPLVYETLYRGIQKQIHKSATARKLVAIFLMKISYLYMEAKRVVEGKVLTNRHEQHLPFMVVFDFLWARIVAAIFYPLHMLGRKLLYSRIQASIGILKAGVSGGGSLPSYIDLFFEAIGIKLQNGYGLTECSPVIAARRPACNVLGTVGPPLPHTEIKISDLDTGEDLPPGSKGLVKVKGPQVMKGYYKNPSATNQVFDMDGWLSTGDIGWIAPDNPSGPSRRCGGMLVLEGRAKDTIVLTTGENIEPSELENAAMRSNLIHQIVVIGQDQRHLGALIVPNKDEIVLAARKSSTVDVNDFEITKEKMMALLRKELAIWTSGCSFQIGPILIVDEPFTIESGLMTPTMKIRRDKVAAKFSTEIAKLFN